MAARFIWYWKANSHPWSTSETAKWDTYSDIENEIIEDAYAKKLETVELDDYIIDLKNNIQKSKTDEMNQRPIKRMQDNVYGSELLRRDRFFLPPQPADIPSFLSHSAPMGYYSKFLECWKKDVDHKVYKMNLATNEFENALQIAVDAATGIIEEGTKLGKRCEAIWIADSLKSMKEKSKAEICKHCAWLYTRECFLYKLLNKCLRESDLSKLRTLGPFSYLLDQYLKSESESRYKHRGLNGTVYRGADLTPDMIKCYEHNKSNFGHWPAFTSTTKNRSKAEAFGNVLFIIDLSNMPVAADVSSISAYTDEEEVLLSVRTSFFIRNVEKTTNGKTLIDLLCVISES
ncbi:unnamed protein product [Rotaria sp. Silwood1]|nr:unnamed protein product [Rotaria sp. Silwood1]CAF1656000.1 unnamed protein product [Rotaria sp. Silwood1]CAF3809466.1 unnamed protein product [Rotaria sp. Silwood1]CAF3834214.1 unnamed protein product [Rotaria sp. Silwood1]CAF4846463.1 unnamed protein product [Rotaria sp. Silwood1]